MATKVSIAVAVAGYLALLALPFGDVPGRAGTALYLASTVCLIVFWLTGRDVRFARALSLVNLSLIAVLAAMWGMTASG